VWFPIYQRPKSGSQLVGGVEREHSERDRTCDHIDPANSTWFRRFSGFSSGLTHHDPEVRRGTLQRPIEAPIFF
jgi:hypothetical protein